MVQYIHTVSKAVKKWSLSIRGDLIKALKTYMILFVIGGTAYSLIELLWRGYTHISMALAGGICLMLLYWIYCHLGSLTFLSKCIVGALVITAVEFGFGCIVNRAMGLDVWDYSDRFLNIMGQICPVFTLVWFFICIPAFGICRTVFILSGKGEDNEK